MLQKAKLIGEGGVNIEFQFNPEQLSFTQTVKWKEANDDGDKGGARTQKNLPKMSFSHPDPITLTLATMFDTYETGGSVYEKYITPIMKSMDASPGAAAGGRTRPPVFLFTWGSTQYLKCVMTSFTYTLSMFLPDGTPVRAKVDLKLEQVDEVM